ncbi:hypothetical protein BD779DRAFT_1666986 [Infundibulicybe gibba]|nr:hypothetical protein BD779DRAFT_1666986 [Infundibulicybe gibba]
METPALVLVPPTPLKFTSSTTPSPSSTSTAPTSFSQSRFSNIEQERTSSETTIFSIYSMYGDEQSNRGSWSASPASPDRRSKDVNGAPTVNLTLPDNYHNSFFKSNGFPTNEIAFYDPDVPKSPPPTRTIDLTKAALAATGAPPVNGTSRNSYINPRPLQPIPLTLPDGQLSYVPLCSRSIKTETTICKPLAQFARVLSEYATSSYSILYSSTASPPNSTTCRGQHVLPLKHAPNLNSPSSMTSLVPSEGEDMDAFHVRNTYAQLEASGVKGDGYEEGVERTRARVGPSRTSQQNAEAAVGDGKEKTRELDPREIQTLASLDRYGFFTVPSHDRLVLLTSTPLLKRLSQSSAASTATSSKITSLEALPSISRPPKEASRIAKWTRMVQPLSRDQGGNVETWRIMPSKESKLRSRTYKGIPDRWRGATWELLLSRFSKLSMREMATLTREYHDALDKPSTYDIQIDLDVPRTISGHVMFRTRYGAGQRSLFHVLHCFSLRCDTCGYVQGMGPIAATLLCYFEPERVYASLVRLHDAYSMHTVFSPGFPGLLEAIYIQERITEQMMPNTQLRLWDVFLLEGYDVFIAVAVAIVWVYRDHITSASANFETILSLLSSFFVPEDEDILLGWMEKTLGDKKLRANITQWRNDWRALVASGKDGAALL